MNVCARAFNPIDYRKVDSAWKIAKSNVVKADLEILSDVTKFWNIPVRVLQAHQRADC